MDNQQTTENREEVVIADKVGVSFRTDISKDDYKSRLINLFRRKNRKKDKNKPEKVWALEDITFTGYQGEILGIIGSNGAGKTTLSKIITGIIKEDKGFMHVNGKVTALFSFGMGFNRELTGRDNVYLNGMMLGIDKEVIDLYFHD